MRIAIPIENGKLGGHFGHCPHFMLIDADPEAKTILKQEIMDAPPHGHGVLPRWLAQQGTTVVIAGHMGAGAKGLFDAGGVQVVLGAPAEAPERLAQEFLEGRLVSGEGICLHHHHHQHQHHHHS